MMIQSLLLICGLITAILAQSKPYTDPKSNIVFSQWTHKSGFAFGIAMPQNAKSDFIGQIIAPSKAKWAGASLGPSMLNKILLVSYPNGKTITNSVRLTRSRSNPPIYSGGARITPIPQGTYVTDTQWVSTFLCSGCITGSALSFGAGDASGRLGWAMATAGAVGDAGSANATLGYHSADGTFNIDFAGAKSEKYGAWAAKAGRK